MRVELMPNCMRSKQRLIVFLTSLVSFLAKNLTAFLIVTSFIDGYKSAFLADLFASYLFEKASPIFRPTIYHGIYRYDGLVVFKGSKETSEIKTGSKSFSKR